MYAWLCYYTLEPLLMDTLYKGHNRNNLHIKDRFNGPKWRISYFSQYILNLQREDNLFPDP